VTALLARRRSPFATAALLLVALVAVGGIYALASSSGRAQAAPRAETSTQVEEGKKLFLEGCASCHGMNGEGQFQPDGTVAGPSLIGVGAAAVDFQVGTGRMPLANPGAQAPRKTPIYSDEEIAALAAYVVSLSPSNPGPAVPSPDMYDYSNLTPEELALGGQLYRANCAACHNFAGEGGALSAGKYAPSLMGVDAKHIYQAMLTGPQNMPVFPDTTLRVEDKQAIIGYIKSLETQPNPGGIDLGRLGPVTEGLLLWTLGLGLMIAVAVWIGVKAK
jgi:ubiquinol-cytochrome c reductase cytochrome c subunit